MLKDRLRSEPSSPALHSPPKKSGPGQPQNRASNGLDQFFASLQDQESLSILDFSGASQANISFITSMGHRIYSNDALRTMEEAFGSGGDFIANQSDPDRAARFGTRCSFWPLRCYRTPSTSCIAFCGHSLPCSLFSTPRRKRKPRRSTPTALSNPRLCR